MSKQEKQKHDIDSGQTRDQRELTKRTRRYQHEKG